MVDEASPPVVRNLDEAARARRAGELLDELRWDEGDSLPDAARMTAAEFLELVTRA